MIEIVGIALWFVGVFLILSARACSEKISEGDRNLFKVVMAIFFIVGISLLSLTQYERGKGNPDSFSDNTLYQIESDPINNTMYSYERLLVIATPVTLSDDGSIIKQEEEPKYYTILSHLRI